MSLSSQLKKPIQTLLGSFGYRVEKLARVLPPTERPVGRMREFLQDLDARGFQPHSILDVGANTGAWSRTAVSVFPRASFVLVEPQAEMRPHLDGFCADFPGARWVEAGAGPTDEERTFTVWEDFQGSSLLPGENDKLESGQTRRTIRIITLESLYPAGTALPELVKLDIQGFELEALKGAGPLFGSAELFIMEASLYPFLPNQPIISDVIAFMAARGYDVYDFPGFLRRPLDGALGQADVAFAKRGGILRASSSW